MSRARLDYIQLLRAVAAIGVVLFHSMTSSAPYVGFPARSTDFLQIGGYGVDLFFVISGFVIYYTAGTLTPGTFLVKRLERVIPIYWVITVLVSVMMIFTMRDRGDFTWLNFGMSLSFTSFLSGKMPVAYVGWTLEFEMLFYLCVALSMRVVRNPWALTCAALSAAVGIGTLVSDPSPAIKFFTAPAILEFLMGVLIGQAVLLQRVGKIEALSVLCAAVTLCFGSNVRPLLAGIPAMALVVAAVMARNRRLPNWIIKIGDSSYSIYLVQTLTIPVCTKLLRVTSPGIDPDVFIIAATVFTVLFGMATYSFVETRIRDVLRTRSTTRDPRRASDSGKVPGSVPKA